MKQMTMVYVGMLLAGVLAAGCSRPKLTSRPMSPEEFSWSLILRENYPAWKTPYFSPMTEEGKSCPMSLPGNAVPAPSPVPRKGPSVLPDEVEFVPAQTE